METYQLHAFVTPTKLDRVTRMVEHDPAFVATQSLLRSTRAALGLTARKRGGP
ncbi:MAG: hypothetical protein QM569_13095 [Acidovorax sp.]|uniref:hypothetical protein n=1 Tax=Acidovorax sp. TaxID=1872122 RepID=UPI0039E2873A